MKHCSPSGRRGAQLHFLSVALLVAAGSARCSAQELSPVSPIDSTTKINVVIHDKPAVFDLRQREDSSRASHMEELGIPVFGDRYAFTVAKKDTCDEYAFAFTGAKGLLVVIAGHSGGVEVGVVRGGGKEPDAVSNCLQISSTRRRDNGFPLHIGGETVDADLVPNFTVAMGNTSIWTSFPEGGRFTIRKLPGLPDLTREFGCPTLHSLSFRLDGKLVCCVMLAFEKEGRSKYYHVTLMPTGDRVSSSQELRDAPKWEVREMEGAAPIVE